MASRVLVAYATKMGSNAEIAAAIAGVLLDAGLDAAALPARDVRDLEGWDAIVLGSALYAAHWQHDANRFVGRHREALRTKRLWVFSSGPLDRRLASADLPITPHAAWILGDLPYVNHRTFGGRLDPEAEGVDDQILQTHPIGDFRDWKAIRGWATEIAAALTAP